MDAQAFSPSFLPSSSGTKSPKLRLKNLLKLVGSNTKTLKMIQAPICTQSISEPTSIRTSYPNTAFSTPRAAPPPPTPSTGSAPFSSNASRTPPFNINNFSTGLTRLQSPVPLSVVNGRLNGLSDFGSVRLLGCIASKGGSSMRQKGPDEKSIDGLGIIGLNGRSPPPSRFSSFRKPSFLRRIKSTATLPMQEPRSPFLDHFDVTSPFDTYPPVPAIPAQYLSPTAAMESFPRSVDSVELDLSALQPLPTPTQDATSSLDLDSSAFLPLGLFPPLPIDASPLNRARIEAYEKLSGVTTGTFSSAIPPRTPFPPSPSSEYEDAEMELLYDGDSSDEENDDEELVTPQSSPLKTTITLPRSRKSSTASVEIEFENVFEPVVVLGRAPSARRRRTQGGVAVAVSPRGDGFF